ncbi:MAG: SoxR reducing system RseC family protein [Bacteroidales bacterium]|jgi:sigma-E factor negative regulatory protein RseC|nr:SoxR reducing system RseC family protein [Bacteroidales bacterium]
MSDSKSIEHKGRVESINGNQIKVRFLAQSACASCHAKGVCSAADLQEKEIDVIDQSDQYQVGETVNVILRQSLGFKALWLGYVVPFILVLSFLIILSILTKNEVISGVGALGILIPYYTLLYFRRDRVRKQFTFTLHKID